MYFHISYNKILIVLVVDIIIILCYFKIRINLIPLFKSMTFQMSFFFILKQDQFKTTKHIVIYNQITYIYLFLDCQNGVTYIDGCNTCICTKSKFGCTKKFCEKKEKDSCKNTGYFKVVSGSKTLQKYCDDGTLKKIARLS